MRELTPLTLGQQRPTSEAPLRSIVRPVRSLYAHVPFCFHKCHYCDFYSFVDNRGRQGEFTERLIDELRAIATHVVVPQAEARDIGRPELDTIFVGGGTPSLLKPELWANLLDALHNQFDLGHGLNAAEFTVECNPETVTPKLMRIMRAGGVNRVSIGAQSFNPTHLKTLERWHDPANVERALALAADAGITRRSIDLIYAIPGQTLDDWKRELDTALSLCGDEAGRGAIDHLSCYALTYEPNTAMTKRLQRGDFQPADETLEIAMYDHTVATLGGAGFERYEVSNFARQGSQCRHNMVYWGHAGDGQWLAAGPSASGHAGGHRWKNIPHLGDWMAGIERTAGYAPIVDHETPDPRRALVERLMLGIRVSAGLPIDELIGAADAMDPSGGAASRLHAAARRQIDRNCLRLTPDATRWALTDLGFHFADGVAAELMAAITEP